jgi:serine-type D-Ala-D-Ala carboxypeptidase (penicillin-binding protein 5/6)
MNRKARDLGMINTNFVNATGLPHEDHYSTAWDLALLTQALIKNFPEHYAIYAERSFNFNGIDQPNRNRLLWRDRTVDGVKTGHTDAAGYCLIASSVRDDMRLISVVMGADSEESRMRETQKLLSYGFRYFETQRVYEGGVPLKTGRLWYGTSNRVELGAAEDVHVTFPRGRYEELEAELHVARVIEAPVEAGQAFGELRLKLGSETVMRVPLVALQAVEESGFLWRLIDAIHLFFRNLLSDD